MTNNSNDHIIDRHIDRLDEALSNDAYSLNPDIVGGLVDMCIGALQVLVTAKKGKYPHDPALEQDSLCHLSHALEHMESAYDACSGDEPVAGHTGVALDDDGIPHYHHATARVALMLTRVAIVERERREHPIVTLSCDGLAAIDALSRLRGEAERRTWSVYVDGRNVPGAYVTELKKELHRNGLADANGNAVPAVHKKPVVIGLDGADAYSTAKSGEAKSGEAKNACWQEHARHYLYSLDGRRYDTCGSVDSGWSEGTPLNARDMSEVDCVRYHAINADEGGWALAPTPGFNFWSVPVLPGYLSAEQIQLTNPAVLCSGCVFERYSGGPGYSERCDGCRKSATRPSYEVKA